MFKKIINTFGTKITAAVINFMIAVILSQVLGDAGKGTQALLLTTISFILIFSEIVCGESIVFLTPHHPFKKILVASVAWSGLIAVVMGGCIRLFYPGLEANLVIHVAILSFISCLGNINFRFLVGKEEIHKANYNTLLQPILLILTLIVYYLLLKKTDIYGYVIGLYIAYFGSFLLGVWMLRQEYVHLFKDKDRHYSTVLKDLFKYGFLNQTGHFVQFFNLRLSYYLLDRFIDKGHVGVFSNAVSVAESIWIISSSIALVQYARIANADNREYAQRLTLDLNKICLVISALAIIVLCLLPSSVYVFIFGPDFGGMARIIRILAPGILFFCVFLILGHYYSGIGRYHMNTFAALCGLAVTCVLGFTLIPRYDVTGAAITSAVSYTVNAIFLFVFFLKESHFKGKDFILRKSEVQSYIAELKQQFSKQNTENE
ncbi:MAG: polysaccharide biosynthesis C-terminal domain-containing protein [Bacteroidales bacterium]|jgi:O-antigen/teichoic acid export membrane protein|nr:polysaccharide biosynthesis C-terminal domain-containing protein [Bacteroidales bacterium]